MQQFNLKCAAFSSPCNNIKTLFSKLLVPLSELLQVKAFKSRKFREERRVLAEYQVTRVLG